MDNKLTVNQARMLLLITVPISKLLILPSLYADTAKQDAWLAGLYNFIPDVLLLLAVLAFAKKQEGRTVFQAVEAQTGKLISKTLFATYAVYFLIKAIIPLLEHKNFIEITLYETSPTPLTFLPFFVVAYYFCIKGLRTAGACAEILFWVLFLGTIMVIFLCLGACDAYNLLPIGKNPVKRTLTASYNAVSWYGQPIVILFLAGRLKSVGKIYKSFLPAFILCVAVTVFLYACFTAVYGDIAVRQVYSLTKMTKYSIALSNVGRFDYVAALLVISASTLSISVPILLCAECLCYVLGCKSRVLPSVLPCAVLLLSTVLLNLRFQTLTGFIQTYATPFLLIMTYVLPPLLLLIKKEGTRSEA